MTRFSQFCHLILPDLPITSLNLVTLFEGYAQAPDPVDLQGEEEVRVGSQDPHAEGRTQQDCQRERRVGYHHERASRPAGGDGGTVCEKDR